MNGEIEMNKVITLTIGFYLFLTCMGPSHEYKVKRCKDSSKFFAMADAVLYSMETDPKIKEENLEVFLLQSYMYLQGCD